MGTQARFWVVVDLETTGTDPQRHEIIQLARQTVDIMERRVVSGSFKSVYVLPQHWDQRDPEAMAVNGIGLSTLTQHGVSLREAVGVLAREVNWTESVLASWGLDFELAFLGEACRRTDRVVPWPYKGVDVRSQAFLPLAARGQTSYPSLPQACKQYDVEMDNKQLHDAGYDVHLETGVLLELLNRV